MHIPDGYLGPATYGGAWAVMVPVWGYASRRVRATVTTHHVPYLAMGSVFSLLAMMFMVPIPGGTTGHISGAAVVAILLGPWAAVVAVSVSLFIQGLVFGDGGVTAIAANSLNIAVAGGLSGWGVYTAIVRGGAILRGGGTGPVKKSPAPPLALRLAAGVVSAYLAVNLSALLAAVELGIQPLIYSGRQGGTTYFPYPLGVAIPAVMLPHLTAVGAVEAAVTAMVLAFFQPMETNMGSPAKAALPAALCLTTLLAIGGIGAPPTYAHSIQYEVQPVGMSVRSYYSEKVPAANSRYELFGPGDKEPHQTGRTDRNGFVSFFPDRPGVWRLQVWGESSHGFHGFSTEIRVDKAMGLESFSKPPVATYTKAVTGIGIAFGLFGLYSLWASRRKTSGEPGD